MTYEAPFNPFIMMPSLIGPPGHSCFLLLSVSVRRSWKVWKETILLQDKRSLLHRKRPCWKLSENDVRVNLSLKILIRSPHWQGWNFWKTLVFSAKPEVDSENALAQEKKFFFHSTVCTNKHTDISILCTIMSEERGPRVETLLSLLLLKLRGHLPWALGDQSPTKNRDHTYVAQQALTHPD